MSALIKRKVTTHFINTFIYNSFANKCRVTDLTKHSVSNVGQQKHNRRGHSGDNSSTSLSTRSIMKSHSSVCLYCISLGHRHPERRASETREGESMAVSGVYPHPHTPPRAG